MTINEAHWDYIIVGGGSAGCVLAYRLSADPAIKVLLLEAGPPDDHPFIHLPKGTGKLFVDPRHMWFFKTEAHDGIPSETWLRGKTLGGSSSVNGMVYLRGQPEDYDGWEAMGARGWGWDEMLRCFREMENHELGADDVRGSGGPLSITVNKARNPVTDAFIRVGEALGLERKPDLNRPDQEGVGYVPQTLVGGRRMSAAKAFLKPAMRRANLTVRTGAFVERVLFEGRRAIGVQVRIGEKSEVLNTRKDVILSAGGLQSPKILQLSGIGPADVLEAAGVPMVHESPGVGRHMLEHRLLVMKYALKKPFSYNRALAWPGLIGTVLRYGLFRSGPLAYGGYEVAAFVRTKPELDRPDAEILMAPYATEPRNGAIKPERGHSIHLFGYPLRSRSEGDIRIQSADPATPAKIRPGYLSDPYDREVTLGMFRYIRKWVRHPLLEPLIGAELAPGESVETDDQVLEAFRTRGNAGFHACSTCRMGGWPDAVVDEKLRVRGVEGLRVVDGSVMPSMLSSNTNGPIMAMGWRAADLILAEHLS